MASPPDAAAEGDRDGLPGLAQGCHCLLDHGSLVGGEPLERLLVGAVAGAMVIPSGRKR
jgi:hypothetical protein